jgi:Zn-dependent protease/CBS domain-containing protein
VFPRSHFIEEITMRWSLKLGRFAGIGVYVHWTFFLLLAWIAYVGMAAGENAAAVAMSLIFVLALFACVVLHEFGHALTARRYGCGTRDITLLPIGGVARLERIPEVPMQEFWVAVAGPAVNVVIAAVLFVVVAALGQGFEFTGIMTTGGSFLASLMWVNVALVVFNMLPAFPMDGGRVLRALLATRMSRVEATHIAAGVGQFMAILFGVFGIFSGNWMLLFIAFFVYIGAQAEAQAVEMRSIIRDYRVRDAMIRQFNTLRETDLVADAARESSASHQKDFPVTDGKEIVGLVFYRDVVKALAQGEGNQPVADIMRRDCPSVDEEAPLDRALDKMNAQGCSTLLVERGDELVGMLSEEQLGQWLMLHSSIRKRSSEDLLPAAANTRRPKTPVHS